jgi:hypothetical protein
MYTDKVSHLKLEQAKRKVRQNLKRMKIYLKEREKMIDEVEETQKVVYAKSKAKPIADEAPTIKILEPTNTQKKEPDKFVYGGG